MPSILEEAVEASNSMKGSADEQRREAIRRAVTAVQSISGKGPGSQSLVNDAIAHVGLRGDLGEFGPSSFPFRYDLDEDTRDRLLAHARQDAAYAALNANSAMEMAVKARGEIRLLAVLVIICTVVILAFS